ncbi:MAG: hypothetical protein V3V32_04440 [Dehalococcoidia bacterium]
MTMMQNPRNVLGLDGDGWLRDITVNDADPGLTITQAGAGAALSLPTATTAAKGLILGGDVALYRSAPNILTIPDELTLNARLTLTTATSPPIELTRTTAITNLVRNTMRQTHRTSGNMADGFGVEFILGVQDDTSALVEIARIAAIRDGADNEGALILRCGTNGNEEFLRITAAGQVRIADTFGLATGIVNGDYFTISAVDDDTNTLTELARATGASQPSFDLLLARFGVAALAADVAHRGMFYFTEGGAGVADLLFCIMKSALDAYSAVQVAIG